ncbi:MAG: hypothetical protein ACYSWS_02140 [Planctomycetota bacterium]|jgi:hypothetical protein
MLLVLNVELKLRRMGDRKVERKGVVAMPQRFYWPALKLLQR